MTGGNDWIRFLVAGSLIGLLAACGERSAQELTQSSPVAFVGGAPISQALLDAFVEERTEAPVAQTTGALKASLLTELKQLKAASLAGERNTDARFEALLELRRLELLARRAASVAGIDKPPNVSELTQAYQSYVASLPEYEFHVAHILVATEGAAGVLITRLQAGEDFAKLAATQSADDSKTRGGDLGWIAFEHLPAVFTDAVKTLKPGAFTNKPVHTSYGWHVIRLLDTRPTAVPSLDQVRAQLVVNLQRERYAKFLNESLRIASKAR